jgi:heme/copper-type cytochrome/quinol oxidase subunit 3
MSYLVCYSWLVIQIECIALLSPSLLMSFHMRCVKEDRRKQMVTITTLTQL